MPDMPGMIYEKIEIVHSEVSELSTDEMGMLDNPPMLHWTPNCTQTHSINPTTGTLSHEMSADGWFHICR